MRATLTFVGLVVVAIAAQGAVWGLAVAVGLGTWASVLAWLAYFVTLFWIGSRIDREQRRDWDNLRDNLKAEYDRGYQAGRTRKE
jgi:hypothetical protein